MIAEPGAFVRRNASELARLSERRLAAWRRAGIVVPRYGDREPEPVDRPNRSYSFRDLVGLRLLVALRQRGVQPSTADTLIAFPLPHCSFFDSAADHG